MTEREWDSESNGLDKDSISSRLEGIMDGALSELAEIEAEHDLRPRDVQSGDPVLQRLEALTTGRIGKPYDGDRLRLLVEEATSFRFPNEIPPGYKDADTKPNPYRAAGDYILWHQVLDYAASSGADRLMVLVTNDIKEDWWVLDGKGRPVDGRPELKQELFEHSGSLMTQMMLSEFLAEVSIESPEQVSPATVTEVRESEVVAQIEEAFTDQRADLMILTPFEFEHLIGQLLEAMGYTARITEHSNDLGFDIDARRTIKDGPQVQAIVQAKRYRNMVSTTDVRALYGTVLHLGADQGIFVTTSWFGDSARRFVQDKSLTLIDGPELRRLLREHLGIDVTIPRRISRRPINSDDRQYRDPDREG